MSFIFNPYSSTLLVAGVLALLLSIILFQRELSTIKWFASLILLNSIWSITYSFALSSHTYEQILFWSNMRYFGISFIPVSWVIFILKFINKREWLNKRSIIFMLIVPVITILLIWTNQYHNFFYEEIILNSASIIPQLEVTRGIWYYIHMSYFYFMLAYGLILLSGFYRHSQNIYKKQIRLIFAGVLIPWLVNILSQLGFRPVELIDFTPFAFIATSLVISYGLVRYKLFDVVPFARGKVLQGIHEGMMVLDTETKIVDLNETMKKFLDPKLKSVIGMKLNEVLHKDYSLHHIIARKKDSKLEIGFKLGNKTRYFEIAVTPLRDDDKNFIGTLLLFWDITERKEGSQKLLEQAKQLDQLNQLKTKIFSILAHDLRSPLASLKSLLSIAESGAITNEEFKAILPSITKNVGHTSSLLDNLLHWSISQLEGEVIKAKSFDIHTLVIHELALLEKKAHDKHITINNSIPEETYVFADENMIAVVLRNLINNAIKFCNAGDTITIASISNEEETSISVCDTGIGIDQDLLDKIFGWDIVSQQGTKQEKGTGLGLKLCKEFIEKNHGKIWVESSPDKGSTFHFKLINKQK
ncbi:MAG TPA: histidine kinase N-terminal 7TM domain-containing protein [Cyclobacteriaceae bacterium]|nr:histidine kinase N-terminal 7TM domain-containing protein [Cyclobacteriaceae bacterium]